jgi:predicted  nucleic acid-binding Zn-ribbon protein
MTGITGLMDARFIFDVLQAVAIVLLWLRRPGKEAQERVDDLSSELDVLRERLNHMPLRNELTKLEGSVASMQASLTAMQESAQVTRATVTRIEAYLLRASRD